MNLGSSIVADSSPRSRIKLPLAPSLERRRLQIYAALLMIDAFAILAGFQFTSYVYLGQTIDDNSMLQAQILIPIFWTSALALQVYSLAAITRTFFAQRRVAAALLMSGALLMFAGFATKSTENFSRFASILGLAVALFLLVWVRALVRPLVRRHCGESAINILMIDDGGDPLRVAHAYHVDAREHHLRPDLSDPHMLDRLGLYMMNMDRVMVSCTPERRGPWALVFKSANVSGEILDREVRELGVIGARRGRDFGSLVVSSGPLGLRSRAIKRAFDTTLAVAAVMVLSPLLLTIAVLIKLEDGGPILFVQRRTGRGNRFFPILKFRSMRVERTDAAGTRSASLDDDRITRIGRLIRRTSVDELPQLFNVILGQMSSRIGEIAIMEVEPLVFDMRILIDILDATSVERRGPALEAVYDIALFKQKSGQVSAILTGDTGDQRDFRIFAHSYVSTPIFVQRNN
jgi:hypothetical protein